MIVNFFRNIILIFGFALSISVVGQTDEVQYSENFKFDDGLYLNFGEFKENKPTLGRYTLITQSGKKLYKVEEGEHIKRISYFDNIGELKNLHFAGFWGASADGVAYVFVDKGFHKLTKIGSVIYLEITTNEAITEGGYSATGHYEEYETGQQKVTVKYLIDFYTGELYDYSTANFIELIKKDPELLDEFKSLKGKKMKEYQISNFIDKFNAKYPVKFPVNPFYQFE